MKTDPARSGSAASPFPVHEPARDLPVEAERLADVIVCGGGPAGVAAALAAARTGARTVLLEAHGCLGGIWTSGLLGWVIDGADKPGIMREIIAELDRRGARRLRVAGGRSFACDVEQMKLLLEEMVLAAGIRVQLHTRVAAALRDPQAPGRVAALLTESKSGRQAWAARCFVDATGDGDLAAQAGCGFDFGRPGSPGETQPMSLIALVTGVRMQEIEPFVGGGLNEPKKRLLAELRRASLTPSYAAPTLFPMRDDLFAFMANHEYGASGLDAAQVTLATLRARAEVHRLVAGLRSLGSPWSGLRIVATAEQIGVREGRRIRALYTVNRDDLVNGVRHEDAVCRSTFGIDVHSTTAAARERPCDPANTTRTQPYDIPLRALIAADADNLLLAGRCIGGDFEAHSSYRVTGNAVALGQGAGVAAALAARSGQSPRALAWPAVRAALEALDRPAPVS
ncbi:glucose-inhibited division protein A [Opitutaceae bacterium TAV5]|nr:glucose-inhibited division protein A [Opitutaceae bacterium TAV5]